MSGFGKRYSAFDQFQQRHRWLGFPLAVLQKYADDQGGYLAATITYYGFFAIFPLLLVLTTVLGFVLQGLKGFKTPVPPANPHLKRREPSFETPHASARRRNTKTSVHIASLAEQRSRDRKRACSCGRRVPRSGPRLAVGA
jgi:hypothetical protein